MLTLQIVEELGIDLHERYSDEGFTVREAEAVNLAMQLMQAEGMVEVGDSSGSSG